MKTALLFLRLSGLFLLCLSASLADAKECIGTIAVDLKHADGTLVELLSPYGGDGNYLTDMVVKLTAGDTICCGQVCSGDCLFHSFVR